MFFLWDGELGPLARCCGSSNASLSGLRQLRLLDRRTASLQTHTSATQSIPNFNANCIFLDYLSTRERRPPSILAFHQSAMTRVAPLKARPKAYDSNHAHCGLMIRAHR